VAYAMQFSEKNFSVAVNSGFTKEDTNYKLSSAQTTLMLSYKIVQNHLSIEFESTSQVNGKLKTDLSNENNIIYGTTFLVKDIEDVSRFNFYPTVGITFEAKH
jgi:hypothetical protein